MAYTQELLAYTFQRAKVLSDMATPSAEDGFFDRSFKARTWEQAKHLLEKTQEMSTYLDEWDDMEMPDLETDSESDSGMDADSDVDESQPTMRSMFNAMRVEPDTPQDAEMDTDESDSDDESVTGPHFACRSCRSTKEARRNPVTGHHTCQSCGDTHCYGPADMDDSSSDDDADMSSYPRYNMDDIEMVDEVMSSGGSTTSPTSAPKAKEYHEGSGC